MASFDESRLARGAGELWKRGTEAAFLDAVRDGRLPRSVFDRWLVQDFLFVQGFTVFVSLVAAHAPRDVQSVTIQGLAALNDELDWFEDKLEQRGLDLQPSPHPVCRRYTDYLLASAYGKPVEVLLAIFFGVEAAYCVGWGRCEPKGPYAEFIERWTGPAFVKYVQALQGLVDAHPHPDQQAEFDEVMRLEHDFWGMTWKG